MFPPRSITVFFVLLALSEAGASMSAPRLAGESRPLVLTSIPPLAYLVERLAGDLVEVESMIPEGAQPESYRPSMRQLSGLRRARLYVAVGHSSFAFERRWLEEVLRESPDCTLFEAARDVTVLPGDPHLWLSVKRMRKVATRLHLALSTLLPGPPSLVLERRRDDFLRDLAEAEARLSRLTRGTRRTRFYVDHDAWGYLADELGLEQVALEEHGKEPSPLRLARVLAKASKDEVSVVLAVSQSAGRGAELLSRDLGARVVRVDPMGRDWMATMRQIADFFEEALAP